jgi:hypothetical protein
MFIIFLSCLVIHVLARNVEETFAHFYHAQAIIRNLIFTDRLASLGGIIYNKSCHEKGLRPA